MNKTSINQILEKIKPFYALIFILVIATIFFAFGRLSAIQEAKTPLKIEYKAQTNTSAVINSTSQVSAAESTSTTVVIEPAPLDGPVIGSKSGKKYYFPWCGTVKRIKPENQVPFASIAEAKAAGFTAGGNCKGLQ